MSACAMPTIASIPCLGTARPRERAAQMRTTTECAYLGGGGPDGLGALRFAGLYASWDAARGRAMFALHLPVDARRAPGAGPAAPGKSAPSSCHV